MGFGWGVWWLEEEANQGEGEGGAASVCLKGLGRDVWLLVVQIKMLLCCACLLASSSWGAMLSPEAVSPCSQRCRGSPTSTTLASMG